MVPEFKIQPFIKVLGVFCLFFWSALLRRHSAQWSSNTHRGGTKETYHFTFETLLVRLFILFHSLDHHFSALPELLSQLPLFVSALRQILLLLDQLIIFFLQIKTSAVFIWAAANNYSTKCFVYKMLGIVKTMSCLVSKSPRGHLILSDSSVHKQGYRVFLWM